MKTKKNSAPKKTRRHGRTVKGVERKVARADEKTADAYGHAHLVDEMSPAEPER